MSLRVLKAAGGFARISVKALSSLRTSNYFLIRRSLRDHQTMRTVPVPAQVEGAGGELALNLPSKDTPLVRRSSRLQRPAGWHDLAQCRREIRGPPATA